MAYHIIIRIQESVACEVAGNGVGIAILNVIELSYKFKDGGLCHSTEVRCCIEGLQAVSEPTL